MLRKLFRSNAMRWPVLIMASVLDLAWGVMLILDPTTQGSTPLYPGRVIPPSLNGLIYLGIGALGFWAVTRAMPNLRTLIALLPQQAFLVLNSTAVIYSAVVGHFLDGVARSHAFLLGDHFDVVILTIMHALVLIYMHIGFVGLPAENGNGHPVVVNHIPKEGGENES